MNLHRNVIRDISSNLSGTLTTLSLGKRDHQLADMKRFDESHPWLLSTSKAVSLSLRYPPKSVKKPTGKIGWYCSWICARFARRPPVLRSSFVTDPM